MSLDLGTLVGYLELDDSPFASVLDRAGDKLRDFGGKGAAIAATAGVAIGGALATSLIANLGVDAANDKLAASLGLTEAESARIGSVAGALYAGAYGESMDEVNTAVGAVMSSIEGMSTAASAELEAATATALDFATAFDVDVQRAVATAGTLLHSGLAKDAEDAFDLITAASQRVPAHLREDILDASDEYSQFFNALGIGGQDAFAMLVQASEDGMYGIDKTGDAIKEFTIRATDGSESTATALESMGLNFRTIENQLLAGGPKANAAFQQVVDSLLAVEDPAARAQTAIALFGVPLEDLSVNDIPKFLQQLQNGTGAMDGYAGAADKMSATLNDNASTALTSMKRQAQQLFLSLANDALPVVDDVTQAIASGLGPALEDVAGLFTGTLGPAVTAVTDFLTEHDTTAQILAGTIGVVLVGALVAWAVQATITGIRVAAAWVMSQLGAIATVALYALVGVLIVGYWIAMAIGAMANALIMAAAWFIALGPIGWVIAIVIGLVALIIANWDKVKEWTAAAWSWVADKVVGAWQWIKEKTLAVAGAVVDFVKSLPGKLVSFFLNWTLPGLFIKHWDTLKAGAIEKATALVEWVRGLPGRLLTGIGNLGSLLSEKGKNLVEGLWDGIRGMGSWLAEKVVGFVKDNIPGPIAKALGINSPSRVARDLARWVPAGLALGLDDGIGGVLDASGRLAVAATPNLSGVRGPGADDGRPGSGAAGAGNIFNLHQVLDAEQAAKEINRLEEFAGGH